MAVRILQLPNVAKLIVMKGTISGFPNYFMLADGTKQYIHVAIHDDLQNDRSDRVNKWHFFFNFVLLDMYHRAVRLDVIWAGRTHDKTSLTWMDVYKTYSEYILPREVFVANGRFARSGANQIRTPMNGRWNFWGVDKIDFNHMTRKVQVRKEWKTEYFKNQKRMSRRTRTPSVETFYSTVYGLHGIYRLFWRERELVADREYSLTETAWRRLLRMYRHV